MFFLLRYLSIACLAKPDAVRHVEYLSALGGGLGDAIEEKSYPMDQIVTDADLHQSIVVAGPIALEEVGEIERWLGQQTYA